MIFGLLSLAFAIGAGAEMRSPLARAVLGGLITSTLHNQIVVPVVYTYLDGLRPDGVSEWFASRRRRKAEGSAGGAGLPVPVGD
jgi:HAE1 family hydrophobic/amphiphilic exporter-1